MPLLLRCAELEPGMRLHEALISRGRLLLNAGKVLSRADVEVLGRTHPEAWVRVGDPILDGVVEFEDDSREREVAATAQKTIAGAMSEVGQRFSARASLSTLNISAIHDSVSEVLRFLSENRVSAALLSRTLSSGSPTSEHAGNVFYLSMVLGCAVRDFVDIERQRKTDFRWLDRKISMDLLPLGLGAMLADVGMLPLQHLYASREPLSSEDRQAIREHPDTGADMLPAELSSTARVIVRTHHENFDGSGYPLGLTGDAIHVFGRIVRIADAFDAATARHVYREAKTPARALWEMTVGPYSQCYDPVLMKVFARLIQPFPVGAKLRLRDGRYAAVVRYNREEPFKPTVIIAFDVNGKRLPDSEVQGPVNLADRGDLRIQSFGEESLSYLYGATAADELTITREDFSTLFEAVFP